MESFQDMSGCEDNQKVKYSVGSLIGKALTWWNTQVKTRGREAVVGMTWEDFKTLMREELCPNNEMQKLEIEFWCHVMVGAGHAAYTDRFHKLARLVPHLVTPENKRIERYIYGLPPQICGMVAATKPTIIQSVILKARVAGPRMVNLLNAKNPTAARGFECGGHGNNGNQARGRAFVMGAEEARQDPNIVTGTFTLNNHYATTLFDSRADYSFVTTTFIPLLDIEPNNLGFSYEIEIARGQLIEINKLSRHKAEIVCHEKVVRIPLPHGKMLRVLGERPEEKAKHLMSAKAEGQKLKDIVVVRNFYELFLDDLSGLPPS
ncbi:reverse transcriptase domain-containing protein [Tanacetum coccineum]